MQHAPAEEVDRRDIAIECDEIRHLAELSACGSRNIVAVGIRRWIAHQPAQQSESETPVAVLRNGKQ